MLRSLIASSLLLVATFLAAQSSSERAAVRVTATVQNTPAITLSWAPISSTTALTIYRKPKSATSWGSAVATPAATSTSWTDNNVSTGSNYEYKVVRVSAGVTGTGYINTGVQVPVVDYRGKIILLVDNTLSSALATELSQLTNDLRADGWGVLRSDVSRTASVTSVKSIVQGHYNSDPSNVKALYIVGHVPVPYSGNITPDGHEDTRGARPTDAYYADMDGSWTDNSVNTTATSQQRTWNTPGDGKFDQSDLPSSVELQVGRVDMYDLPTFGTTEVQLMRNYLNKAHSYKVKGWVPNARAVLVDNLQWLGNPVAGSGWRASAMVGQLSPVPTAPVLSFKNYINGQSYLWTAHYGGGLIAVDGGVSTYNGTDGGVTTQELASSVTMGGVFNMALGSFFYDFDSRNNFLRAVIARGDGLTNCWAGIPAWYFHHMGLGENIGYSVAASMNNTGLYPPLTEGWQSSIGRTHMNLMGDPSLRMKMVAPPSNLVVANAGGNAAFSWTASSEGAMGYHIYHVDVNAGVTTRLTTNPVTTTSWTSGTVPFVAGRQYMVRAMMLEIGASGSYYNLSLGAMAVSTGSGTADCLGVVGGTATVGSACNDNDPCTVNDVYNANCQCVGTSITPAASITAAGPTTFCSGGSVVLNANAGTGYSYVWRRDGATISGATSSSLTATQSGSYTVQVGSGSCTTTSTAVTVSASGGMAPTATAQGPTSFCSGGSVVITTAAASGNSYQWRLNGNTINGATGNSYTAIQSGSYTVTVSNGSCSGTSDPVVVSASGSMSTPVINAQGPISFCSGANVILTTQQASGNSYQWYLDGSVIPGATSYAYTAFWNGAHTVVVSNGTCSATSAALSISVGSQPSNSINAGGTTTFCSGGSVVLSGNTSSGYTYSWARNGTTISGATTSSYTATQSGTYIRTVSNNGCSNTSNSVVVTVTGNLTPSITAQGSTSFCTGGSVVLSTASATGNSYVWQRNGTAISGATSSSYTATQAGSYTVVVANGPCSGTSSAVSVTVSNSTTPTITAQGSTSFCTGGSVVLSTASATGNSYVWQRNGTAISGATSSSYTATQAGSYTVVVANGPCSGTSSAVSVTVSNSTTPTITAQGSTSFCTGGSVVLSTASATGNSYVWRRNGTAISGATSSSYTATQAGSYTVVVANGPCSGTSSAVSVTVSNSTTPTITAQGSTSFCTGGSVVLSTASATGNSYVWRRNGTTISGATSSSYTATQAGSYTVVVANGPCSGTSSAVSVTVSNSTTPTITAQGSTSFCTGSSVVLSTASATGNSYVWRRNGTTISGATSSSYTATQAGSYTVVVANGPCSGTSSAVSVTVSGSGTTPTITAQGSTSFCSGGNVILVTQQASGNTYQWRLNGNPINGATNYAYTAFWNGNMTVTVSNGSCTVTSAPVAIQVGTAPAATITASGATSFCSGGSVVLSGNTGNGYTYSWQRNGSTISGASASSYTATTAGNYTRTVTNNGCSATSSPITVSVGSGPSPAITAQGSTSFCSGGNVLLSTASASGNNYVWQRNGTTIAGATSNTYTATMSGNYTVSVTNGNCSGTSAPVAVNASGSGPTPTVNALGPTSFCTGGNVILTTEQIAGATYQWRYNGVVLPGATNHAYTAYLNGAFTVTVTTGTCSATSAQTNINVVPGPTATISADGPTTFCAGSSVTLSTNSGTGYAYTWYRNGVVIPGATANEHTATLTGYYMVRISLSNCTSTSPSLYVQSFSPPSVTCSADPEDAAVNAVANGGLAPYAFNWNTSPTSTTAQANVTASGTYTVVVTDARGCTASCSTTIELPEGNDCMGARTETQVTWGANPSWNNPAGFMINNFAGAFPAPNHLTIGCGSRKLRLTSGSAVVAFLPSNGPIARLPSGTMVNPTSYGNTFAGQLVALKLSVRFDEYDAWYSPSTTPLGDMVVASGLFAGWTVQQVIDAADEKIGNCGNSYTREALNEALTAINEGYAGGIVNSGYLICPEGSGMAPEPAGSINAIAGTAKSIHLVDPSAVVFPNPTSGVTVFSFTPSLPDQRTTFELRSVNGALIESRDLGILPAGVEHRLDWDATGRGAGLYLYRITAGTVVMTGKLVVE